MNILTEQMRLALDARFRNIVITEFGKIDHELTASNVLEDLCGYLVGDLGSSDVLSISGEQVGAALDSTVIEYLNSKVTGFANWVVEPAYEIEMISGLSMAMNEVQIATRAREMVAKCSDVIGSYGEIDAVKYAESACGGVIRGASVQAKRARIVDVKWWRRVIKERLFQQRESVWSRILPNGLYYASPDALVDYHRSIAAYEKWVRKVNGKRIESNQKRPSHSKKQRSRYAEHMARVGALAALCKEAGMRPIYVTFTAPSQLHLNTHSDVEKCSSEHISVSATNSYLWIGGKFRNSMRGLRKQGIACEYVRKFEDHRDGTCHMHLVLWVPGGMVEQVKNYLLKIFHRNKRDNYGDYSRTVHFSDIPENDVVRCVGGYLFKDLDPDSNTSARHAAWAKANKIRTVAFSSGMGVSVWRMLRRYNLITEREGAELHGVFASVKGGDYANFLRAYRAGLIKETYEVKYNKYGEKVQRL